MSSGTSIIKRDSKGESELINKKHTIVEESNTPQATDELNSLSSIKHDEPRTPPLRNKPNYQSPDNTYTSLPPETPSASSHSNFKASNVPVTPLASYKSSPQLKSPSSYYRQTEHDDSSIPPIKQISSTLKTRLSYAFVKHQKGWSNQSLDDLEKILDETKEAEEQAQFLLASPISKHSAKFPSSKITKPNAIKSPSKPVSSSKSPIPQRRLSSESLEQDEGSANYAFLQAINKVRTPKKKPSSHSLHTAPSIYATTKPSPTKPYIQRTPKLDTAPNDGDVSQHHEAEAIASLMSLSSPAHNFKAKQLPSVGLPRQKLDFDNMKDDQAVETEVDTEYEDNNVTDEEM